MGSDQGPVPASFGLRVGVAAFVTDLSMSPTDLARAVEERGFECLLLAEHTHVPASRQTPYPGGELPEEYYRSYDPLVSLGAASSVTTRLALGTGVCLLTQHDPIVLAKATATLDRLSAGRLIFGVGAGWNREEMRDHGTDPDRRWAIASDRLAAIRKIWSLEVAEHTGVGAAFGPMYSWPKPIQQPGPPVVIGGSGDRAMRWAIAEGDGWMPARDRISEPLAGLLGRLRSLAASEDRPCPSVTLFGALPQLADLWELQQLGVDRAVLRLVDTRPDAVLRTLDRWVATGLTSLSSSAREVEVIRDGSSQSHDLGG